MENNNIAELKELVYAPLQALSEANVKLNSSIVDYISTVSELNNDEAGNYTAHLNTIQMQYKQLRSDADDNTVTDLIGLEIPLLSICPLSALKISKTKVAFNMEIKEINVSDESVKIYTQVCSEKQRKSANVPRIKYEIELESAPISEGLARFIDVLNVNSTPKQIFTKPLDESGNELKGEELEFYKERLNYMEQEAELNEKLREIKKMIRNKNKMLSIKIGMNYDEYLESPDYDKENHEDKTVFELCNSIAEYREIRENIEEQLEELQKKKVLHYFNDQEAEKNDA
jgi:hypothetical protein